MEARLPDDTCIVFYFFENQLLPMIDYVNGSWEECKRKVYQEIGSGDAFEAWLYKPRSQTDNGMTSHGFEKSCVIKL